MLYDPGHDIGNRQHILRWVGSKPRDEAFVWTDPCRCACGQYSAEFFGGAHLWMNAVGSSPFLLRHVTAMNYIAQGVMIGREVTFGALHDALLKEWCSCG